MLMLKASRERQDFKNELLHACRVNLAYDRQCENDRVKYLHDLICETGDRLFFRDELMRCLNTDAPEENIDIVQIFCILCKLAEHDPLVDRTFLKNFLIGADYEMARGECMNAFVYLEGIDGLLICIRRFGQLMSENDDHIWLFRSLISTLRLRDGVETVAASLARNRGDCTELEKLMSLDESKDQIAVPAKVDSINYAQAKAEFNPKKGFPRSWVKNAPTQELIEAADDLLVEKDDQIVWRYLQIFGVRDYPRPPQTIFHFVESSNGRIAMAATRALARLGNPEIRTYALALLNRTKDPGCATRLLRNTFVTGDLGTVEAALKPDSMDENSWHGLGLAVLDLIKNSKISADEYRNFLIKLYEEGPCSLCRTSFVEKLLALGDMPDWMAEECLFDAEPDTVALLRSGDMDAVNGSEI